MALELRRRLERETGLTLSTTLLWKHPTVRALASSVLSQLQLDVAPPVEAAPVTAHADLDALSNDDLAALLARELERA
jgi:hypothetical protein